MNCDDFSQRMHEQLDARVPVNADRILRKHASNCDSCRAELEAWQQIASVMPGSQSTLPSHSRALGRWFPIAIGLAAALLIAFTFAQTNPDSLAEVSVENNDRSGSNVNPESLDADSSGSTDFHFTGELNPVAWWEDVRNHDWVGQTMPAVESVRNGVAPLGRSLMRAASLLAVGGGNQTS